MKQIRGGGLGVLSVLWEKKKKKNKGRSVYGGEVEVKERFRMVGDYYMKKGAPV